MYYDGKANGVYEGSTSKKIKGNGAVNFGVRLSRAQGIQNGGQCLYFCCVLVEFLFNIKKIK